MSRTSIQFQQISSDMVFRTTGNQEISISDLKLFYIINNFSHHLLPSNCDEILSCEDQVNNLFIPSLIAQLDSIRENEANIYQTILNIEEDFSKISYFDIKATIYLNLKHKAETSTYLLMDNYLKFHANTNKPFEVFILFRRQSEFSTFARYRNPILPRFKFWKAIFKDQISHSNLSLDHICHSNLSVNILQLVVLNLCNIWFIQALLSFIIPNSHDRDDEQSPYSNYE